MKNVLFTAILVSLIASSLLNWAFMTGKMSLAETNYLDTMNGLTADNALVDAGFVHSHKH